MKPERLFVLLFLSFLLAGCGFSLAADITPPPGSEIPTLDVSQSSAAQESAAQESGNQSTPVAGPLYPLVAPSPADGKAIYEENCAACHGAQGMGDGERAPSLPNPVVAIDSPELARRSTPAQWFLIVSQGNLERFMPPFPSLSDRQRWDVIAYSYSLSAPPESIVQAKELYQDNCARCHGERGKGDGPDAAATGAVMKDFTDQEFMAGKSGSDLYLAITDGVPPGMPGFSAQLSEQERWSLAGYLRWLTFANGDELVTLQGTPLPAEDAFTTSASPSAEISPTLAISPTQNLGSVAGLVTNGSGGDIPVAAEVTLHAFDQMQMVISDTTTVKPDGTYTFSDIETLPGRAFFTTLEYAGITYGSELVSAEVEDQQLDLPISVFETTTDSKDLKVDRLHLFFEPLDQANIRVAELYVISNNGSKTVVPAEQGKPSLSFDLPEGAANLEFQDGELGERFIQSGRGFGDTFPIRPGAASYQVLLAYSLPYKGKLELSQTMTLPTDAIVIMVTQDAYKVKGENIEPASSREVQGVSFEMYNGSGLSMGDELRLTVSGRSGGEFFSSSSRDSLVIGLGSLGLVLILLGVWVYWRNRRKDGMEISAAGQEIPSATKTETPETLMDAILALDDQFQAGELPENAYLERRAALKVQLKDLLDKEQGKKGASSH